MLQAELFLEFPGNCRV